MNHALGYRQLRLAMLELVAVILAAMLTSQIPEADLSRSGILIVSMLHFFAFYLSKISVDVENRGLLLEFEKTIGYSIIFALILTFASFMLEDSFEISRRGVIYFTLINFGFVYLLNCLVRQFKNVFLLSSDHHKKTIILTTSDRLETMSTLFEAEELPLKHVVGLVVMDGKKDMVQIAAPILTSVDDAIEFSTREVVDHIFINLPSDSYNLRDLASEFELLGIDVSIDINSFGFKSLRNKKIQQFGDHSIVTFASTFYKPSHIFLKRFLDIVGALIGLIMCAMVSIVLVPLIRKDGGPAIFVQKRVGKNGRIFKFYKFRSMYMDAEERKKELLAQNQMQGGMFKMEDDPRITPIGHFIRKTSLDELPQFYNVLLGDMSLVGTRPPTVDEFENYTPSQKRRLSFKPGITGLWQVSGRSNITDFDEVVRLDVEYIDNWNIWSDVKILLKTIAVVLKREGSK